MIFGTVYLGTCIRRLNITKFDSIRMFFMRNDRVLIPVLHETHDANCFSPGVYSYFHRQLSDKFILSQKCQRFRCMSIKKRGRAGGSIENGASLRLIYNLS